MMIKISVSGGGRGERAKGRGRHRLMRDITWGLREHFVSIIMGEGKLVADYEEPLEVLGFGEP